MNFSRVGQTQKYIMLGFPRYADDIFQMKRPQFAGRYFGRDFDEEGYPFMDHQTSQQFKQPRRVPVPVQHEPTFQHQRQQQRQYQPQQMPVPQPTGTARGNPNTAAAQPSNESRQRVRSPIQIPVRHVPIVQQLGDVYSPSERSKTEMIVPVRNEQAPLRVQSPKEMEIEQEDDADEKLTEPGSPKLETPERPLVRKQTSLIVSDDHTTPIPLPYERLHAGVTIMEHTEDGEANAKASTKNNHRPLRKQTSVIVSEDHTTPIPMPYEHLHAGDVIMEHTEDGEENAEASTKSNHRPLRKQTSLIVSEDHTTPIPMPYEHLHAGDAIMEHTEDGGENAEASTERNQQTSLIVSEDHTTPIPMPYDLINVQHEIVEPEQDKVGKRVVSPSSLEINDQGRGEKAEASGVAPKGIPLQIVKSSAPDEIVKDTSRISTASVVLSPRSPRKFAGRPFSPEARDIPITVQGRTRPAQRSTQPERSEPSLSESTGNSGMPQPQPTGSVPAAESTQPKPAPPQPKEQWVDPRIEAAFETIEKVWCDAEALGTQADALEVTTKDRAYLLIEEQLTKLLLKLDTIDSFGNDGVRSKRKSCIRQVQQTLDALELKLEAS